MLASGIAECCGQVGFAEADQPQEDNVGFFFDEAQPEEFLDLEPIDLLWPVPAEGFQGFDDRKTSGFDPAGNNAVLPCGYFALDEAAQVVEMAPVIGGAFGGQGLAVFLEVRQLEVIKVLIQEQVGRIFSHGLITIGMVLEAS